MSPSQSKELNLHERLRGYTIRKLTLSEKSQPPSSLCPKYTLPTAASYTMMNGDEKLARMRLTLHKMRADLGKKKSFIPHQQCHVGLIVGRSPASENSGEEPFLMDIRRLKNILDAEKDKLKAIRKARNVLGKKFLWPRWGKPRVCGAGKKGCLNEVRQIVYKRRGREDVLSTCLDRRTFRDITVCDNCELVLNEKNYQHMDMAKLHCQHTRKMKTLCGTPKMKGEEQGAAPKNDDEDLENRTEDSTDEEDFTIEENSTVEEDSMVEKEDSTKDNKDSNSDMEIPDNDVETEDDMMDID